MSLGRAAAVYDCDFVAPAAQDRSGSVAVAIVVGVMLGVLLGSAVPIPRSVPAPPSPSPVAARQQEQLQLVEEARAASKMTPWQRAEKAGRANHEPFWDPRHHE